MASTMDLGLACLAGADPPGAAALVAAGAAWGALAAVSGFGIANLPCIELSRDDSNDVFEIQRRLDAPIHPKALRALGGYPWPSSSQADRLRDLCRPFLEATSRPPPPRKTRRIGYGGARCVRHTYVREEDGGDVFNDPDSLSVFIDWLLENRPEDPRGEALALAVRGVPHIVCTLDRLLPPWGSGGTDLATWRNLSQAQAAQLEAPQCRHDAALDVAERAGLKPRRFPSNVDELHPWRTPGSVDDWLRSLSLHNKEGDRDTRYEYCVFGQKISSDTKAAGRPWEG